MSSKCFMLLNRYIGTEKMVKKRRKYIFKKYFWSKYSDDGMHAIPSGSKAEGLDMPGSDEDIMMWPKHLKLYFTNVPNIKSSMYDLLLHAVPVVETPGFVIINGYQMPDKTFLGIVKSSQFSDICMAYAKNVNGVRLFNWQRHGPCRSHYGNGFDTDIAVCLSSDQWPDTAEEWRKRKRHFGWPKSQTITSIIRQGCHVVPVGYNGNQGVDWRMSFSLAETILIHSFHHVQLLTYGFLKMFLKEVINVNPAVDNLLCSYFMKTILFWTVEETPVDCWTANNILTCVWMCLKRLFRCIENKHCPNYFIRDNNMFKKKITDEAQQHLLTVMRPVMDDGVNSVFRSMTLRNMWNEKKSVNPSFEERRMDFLNIDEICNASVSLFGAFQLACMSNHYRLEGSDFLYRTVLEKYFFKCKGEDYSFVIRNIALQNFCHCMRLSSNKENKQLYSLNNLFTRFLIAGSTTDISAGKLILASWLYGRKQYNQCLEVINYAINRMKDALYYNQNGAIALREAAEIESESCDLNFSCSDKARLFLLSNVLMPLGSGIALPELRDLFQFCEWISKGEGAVLIIPPNLYCHFLRACCYNKLGKLAEIKRALYDLKQEKPILPNDSMSKDIHQVWYFCFLSFFLILLAESRNVNLSEFNDFSTYKEEVDLASKSLFACIENSLKCGLNVDFIKHVRACIRSLVDNGYFDFPK